MEKNILEQDFIKSKTFREKQHLVVRTIQINHVFDWKSAYLLEDIRL